MPTQYDIVGSRSVVVIRHYGHITVAESEVAFRAFQHDPDLRPGQHHLVDCNGITSYEKDFVRFMALQAEIAGKYGADAPEFLLVLLGSDGVAHELANLIRKTWEATPSVLPRVVRSEEEAMDILGLQERDIAELLGRTEKN